MKITIRALGIVAIISMATPMTSAFAATSDETVLGDEKPMTGSHINKLNGIDDGTVSVDSWGREQVVDSNGDTTTYRTDGYGRRIGSDGSVASIDSWGREEVKDKDGKVTTYTTDGYGRKIGSDGSVTSIDSWGRTVIKDASGKETVCSKNSWGKTECK